MLTPCHERIWCLLAKLLATSRHTRNKNVLLKEVQRRLSKSSKAVASIYKQQWLSCKGAVNVGSIYGQMCELDRCEAMQRAEVSERQLARTEGGRHAAEEGVGLVFLGDRYRSGINSSSIATCTHLTGS